MVQDENNTRHINHLCELGCKLALDDFGTGFSSLSHLINFPINIVKLDKSLLPSPDADIKRVNIVKGIAAMVGIIELHIVAEGVENQYQWDLCKQLNVNELQGYFFEKPNSATVIEQQWFKKLETTHFNSEQKYIATQYFRPATTSPTEA